MVVIFEGFKKGFAEVVRGDGGGYRFCLSMQFIGDFGGC